MRKLNLFILLLLLVLRMSAQDSQLIRETAVAYTDKDCYVAGERLHLSVRIMTPELEPMDLSRVAYAELSDTTRMQAQVMVALNQGAGWADIALPPTLHSGNYMLTVYTRNMRNFGPQCFFRKVVSVVNTLRLSQRDDLLILKPESLEGGALPRVQYAPGQKVHISLPTDSILHVSTLSLVQWDIPVSSSNIPPLEKGRTGGDGGMEWIPEAEGHIVTTRQDAENKATNSSLVMVGKGFAIYDGQPQPDGTWLYYSNGIYGAQPTLLNGYGNGDSSAPLAFKTPYAQVLPESLPQLQIWASEEDLRQRSVAAQYEHSLTETLKPDTLAHTTDFLSVEPEYYYDMDEYTRFNTVKEALKEFVLGVRSRTVDGVRRLYTYNSQEKVYSRWPALVLLDGMPIYNIDEMLAYDSRLLKYIQVYSGSYTFGESIFQGVVSFISRKGRLSNFKLDGGSRLVTYRFPEQRPQFAAPESQEVSTVLWDPHVESSVLEFNAPSRPGTYRIIIQGLDCQGKPFRSVSDMVIADK